jgi:N-acetylneuraminic acid mutarotase
VGGRGATQGTQTAQILAIDPHSGRLSRAGRLPTALSDAGVTAYGDAVLVAGGREAGGALSDRVILLRARSGAR